MEIRKGKQYTVSAKFSRKGSPAVFVNPPMWSLYNSSDDLLVSSSASQSGAYWNAIFTVPSNYVVPSGKEDLLVQFHGTDNQGNSYITDKPLVIIDDTEVFAPNGVFFNYISDENISDFIIANDSNATINAKVFDPIGTLISETDFNLTYDVANSSGYRYNVSLPKLEIIKNTWIDPFTILYTITTSSGTVTETRPLYVLDFKVITYINSLQLMLDKAKLIEIDPSLQWHLVELIEALHSGIKRINGTAPEVTFWKFWDFPSPLDRFLTVAAAISALESRFLAEGLNAFDFQGLNTQLNFNRTDYLSQMIDRYNNLLDQLPQVKKSAIAANGKGETNTNEIDNRLRNLGSLALGINPLNNRIGYQRFRRFY